MKHLFSLEAIGHNAVMDLRSIGKLIGADTESGRLTCSVSEVLGICRRRGLVTRPVHPNVDYSYANSKGSRGVFYHYHLQERRVYEVRERLSWQRSERYFIRHDGYQFVRLDGAEVVECLP